MPKHLKYIVSGFIMLLIASHIYTTFITPGIELYNKSINSSLQYDALTQKQITNFDGYYSTYKEKFNIADINKETFITVTQIIMENRADGKDVAWKWTQENTHIPYDQFTQFYSNLSSFTEELYKSNMAIEVEKQKIVKDHNEALLIFPNNVINKFINIKPLKYEFGFISKETEAKFSNSPLLTR